MLPMHAGDRAIIFNAQKQIAAFRICKQLVLPAHYKGFHTAFRTVIEDLQLPIPQKPDQVWPLFPQIVQCLAQRGLRHSGALRFSPCQ